MVFESLLLVRALWGDGRVIIGIVILAHGGGCCFGFYNMQVKRVQECIPPWTSEPSWDLVAYLGSTSAGQEEQLKGACEVLTGSLLFSLSAPQARTFLCQSQGSVNRGETPSSPLVASGGWISCDILRKRIFCDSHIVDMQHCRKLYFRGIASLSFRSSISLWMVMEEVWLGL